VASDKEGALMKFRLTPLAVNASEDPVKPIDTWSGGTICTNENPTDQGPPPPEKGPSQLSLLREQLREALQ